MSNQVSFATAFRYYEAGHSIESVESGRTFEIEADGKMDNAFDGPEIRGKWIVEGIEATDTHLPGYEHLKVTGARVLIKQVPVEDTTASGIVLMPSATEPKFEGTIVVAGPGNRLETGVQMPMEVKAGDKIIYSRMAGVPIEVEVGGEEVQLLVMNERDIIAVIE
ncbi:10 kDa chaperonin [compost metagenome]